MMGWSNGGSVLDQPHFAKKSAGSLLVIGTFFPGRPFLAIFKLRQETFEVLRNRFPENFLIFFSKSSIYRSSIFIGLIFGHAMIHSGILPLIARLRFWRLVPPSVNRFRLLREERAKH